MRTDCQVAMAQHQTAPQHTKMRNKNISRLVKAKKTFALKRLFSYTPRLYLLLNRSDSILFKVFILHTLRCLGTGNI